MSVKEVLVSVDHISYMALQDHFMYDQLIINRRGK
jgi:hypothetical protein